MNEKRKGLGKGLDALLGLPGEADLNTNNSQLTSIGYHELPVEWLQRGRFQPRQEIDRETLRELAESIKERGVMQPILVRRLVKNNSYEIVAGERRWRAAQLAGLSKVPTFIKELSDQDSLAIALVENMQRENLNAMEEARALVQLQEEFGFSQQQVANAVGKSRSAIANLMRLTALHKDVADMVAQGDLDMGHGRALLALDGEQQLTSARSVVSKSLSVRQTEALVRHILVGKDRTARDMVDDPDINRLEQRLATQLGAGVKIAHRNGKGKLTIRYNSVAELEGILEHIK
jgi:ParB family transcriptional regulator, chromosome partitioning protein